MEKMIELNSIRKKLYKYDEPFLTGMLKVSEIHTMYYEVSGNKNGKTALILHGGPGGGSAPFYRGFFDPEIYKVIMIDQRGSGNSTPHASLEENTTWDLIEDIEKLRITLDIEKFHTVFGGSWGSTLSIAYAQTFPSRVGHLVLRGIFLCRPEEINFFYQEGSNWIFPEFHEELKNVLPEVERGNILHNYYRRLTGNDQEIKLKCAKAWTKWEMATSKLFINRSNLDKGEEDKFALAFARIETHYFVNGAFMKKGNQLLEDAFRIKEIPTVIVQGRYDVICPAKSAYELHKLLPNSVLEIVPDAGHSCSEEGIIDMLVRATDKFKSE
jgi:proline iminopeptidase